MGGGSSSCSVCRTDRWEPTCRRMPPFQRGQQNLCFLHFVCHSSCQCLAGVLEAKCQLRLPHSTPALYGQGAGPLKGIAEQQQGLSPSSLATCICFASFLFEENALLSSSGKASSYLQKAGSSHFLSQEGRVCFGGILFLSIPSSSKYSAPTM